MNKNTTRATAVIGTTMAFVIAGTAAAAAAGPRDRDDVRGFGGPQMSGKAGMRGGPAMGGMRGGMKGGPAMGGMRGGMGGGVRGLEADLERSEHTVQTADGTTTARVEQGIVDSAAADSLSFSLASGEAVTVVIDEDTQAIAFEEQEVTSNRGWSRTRLAPSEVEATAIEAGTEIVVWSDSEDGADFVASRIAVQPAEAEDDADEDTAAEADAEEATEDAAASDA